MAQNSYGMLIISGVSMAFGLIFFIRFIRQAGTKEKREAFEFFILFLLSAIITLRTLQIYIPFVEWIFALSGLALAGIYFSALIRHARDYMMKNKTLAWLIGIGYTAIVLFCLAMILMNVKVQAAGYAGILALLFIASFLFIALVKKGFLVEGEKISVFRVIAGFHDRFYLLSSLFILFSLYLALTTNGVLPKLYSNKFPQAYYELVNQAETGKEKPVDGKFRYEEFKKMYDQFVQRNVKEVK
jgi:hypothetical protein